MDINIQKAKADGNKKLVEFYENNKARFLKDIEKKNFKPRPGNPMERFANTLSNEP